MTLARDGSRLLGGVAAARQRLDDALRIPRGSYPWNRGFGSRLADLVDRSANERWQAEVYAAVAEAVSWPANRLGDVRLRRVRVAAAAGGAIAVEVDADYVADAGVPTPLTLRAELAPGGAAPLGPTPHLPARGILVWRDRPLLWRGGQVRWGD